MLPEDPASFSREQSLLGGFNPSPANALPPPVTFVNTSFDVRTGELSIQGDAGNNILKQAIANNGYVDIDLDGQMISSDPSSIFFDARLGGATIDTIKRISFNGGDGSDTLWLGDSLRDADRRDLVGELEVNADSADVLINGHLSSATQIDIEADNITAQGEISGRLVTLHSRNALNLGTGTKITASDGDKGGTIHLLGKEVSLTGVEVNADGVNGGGTVLIGGDYQGKGSVPNARNTFVDASTVINVDALQKGNGGKVVVWADDTTRFSGKINARGGSVFGDGGFAEVSGKQNLEFSGNADLSAANGKLGDLLLDPANIIISDAEDKPGDTTTVNAATLGAQTGNVSLVASNNILQNVPLFFNSPGGSITFRATGGSFSSSADIIAAGRNVSIFAPTIKTGNIYTSSSETKGGSIVLDGSQGIATSQLIASSTAGNGGNIKLTSTEGSITSDTLYTTGDSGNGGNVSLTAAQSINVGYVASDSVQRNAGNIKIASSAGSIVASNEISTTAGQGNGGNVTLNAFNLIDVHGVRTTSSAGKGGNVTLSATNNITATASFFTGSFTGDGGKINITSKDGSIDVGNYNISSNSTSGSGGNITMRAGNLATGELGTITTGLIDSGANGNGNGGKIDLLSNGDIKTSAVVSNSNGTGNSGNITMTSKAGGINTMGDSIATSSRLVFAGANGGKGGKVTLSGYDDIVLGGVNSGSNTGIGSDLKITSDKGSIDAGEYAISSSQLGNAGKITITAEKDIKTGVVNSSSAGSQTIAGRIRLVSNDGNIEAKWLRSDSAQGKGGNIAIDAGPKLGSSGGTVRVTDTININGAEFSIFAGINGNPKLNISYFSKSGLSSDPATFTVGDATASGTKGIVMAGTDAIVDVAPIEGVYTLGNIKINTIVQVADTPLLQEIKARVQKSYIEALKPIGINTTTLGIPGFVTSIPEVRRIQASKELAIEAAYNDPKLSPNALLVASTVFSDIKRILSAADTYNVTDKAQIAYILSTASHESQFGIVGAYAGGSATHNPMYEYSGSSIGSNYDFSYFSRGYDGRVGNAPRGEGDGFRYRDRGYVQLTGKKNYARFQTLLGVDITATDNGKKVTRPVVYTSHPYGIYNDRVTISDVTQYSDESDPDKVANDKDLASKIMVLGMKNGLFTGLGFSAGEIGVRSVNENNPNFFNARQIINGFNEADKIEIQAYKYLDTLKHIKY
jgi:hypothetical protein